MKAYVLHGINELRYEEVPTPQPKQQEVLLRVRAAGICGSDIPRIYQTGAHVHPLIPGHEFAGEVVQLGEGVEKTWLGKRVGVFPLLPCHSCEPCLQGQYELCRHYSYLGSRCDGGFAEYAAVPVSNLLELPDKVSFEAAAMLEPMAVAVHALRRVLPKQTERIAVCGLGTIGMLLLMLLLEAGGKDIYAIGNKDFQRQQAVRLGLPAGNYCDGKQQDSGRWLMDKTAGAGVNVFFECVGKNETVSQAIDHTAPNGRIMLVGNPGSDMNLAKQTYWKLLRNQLTVTGTWNSSFTHEETDDWHYVADLLAKEKIHPQQLISHRFSLAQLDRGFHIMRDKGEDYLKIMMHENSIFP